MLDNPPNIDEGHYVAQPAIVNVRNRGSKSQLVHLNRSVIDKYRCVQIDAFHNILKKEGELT
jgi:hypothetical protein